MTLFLFISLLMKLFSFSDDYRELSWQTSREFDKEIEKKFQCRSIGGNVDNIDEIEYYSFAFHCPLTYSKEDARLMIVPLVEELLKKINNNNPIRPYLTQFPFDEKRISVSFLFMDDYHEYVKIPNLAKVSASYGKVRYTFVRSQSGIDKDEYEEVESYEDAKRIYLESIREE